MDRRLIQTAVLGSPDSDDPALCPEDAQEFDAYLAEHGDNFWCGTSLEGGCGRRLSPKRYTDRVCHFAHYRDGEDSRPCGRQVKGRDGANHLFVKADFAKWLADHEISASFEYPEPTGSAVVMRLEGGRVILVHLDKSRPVPWNDEALWEIVLGPGVPADGVLERRGYVHRIRLEDQSGRGRSVRFGTQRPGASPDWSGMDRVLITDDGLAQVDPPAAVVPAPAADRAPSVPVQRELAPVASAPVRQHTPASRERTAAQRALSQLDSACSGNDPQQVVAAMHAVREFLAEGIGEDSGEAEALQAGLDRGRQWQDQRAEHRRAIIELVQKQFADGKPVGSSLARAEELVRDDDASPEQRAVVSDLRARFQQRVDEWQQAQEEKAARRAADLERAMREREDEEARQVRMRKVRPFVSCVRGALKKAARDGSASTWEDLKTRTGENRLVSLSHQERVDLLVLVERGRKRGEPLLSTALAVAGDHDARQVYRDVAKQLGRPVPATDEALFAQLVGHRKELYRQRS